MALQLAAIDLDGTLLKNDCTVSKRNRAAILRALEKGYLVVPSTGRGYRNTRYVLRDFPGFPYYATGNGTVISRGDSGNVLFSCTIPREIGISVFRIVREAGAFQELYHQQDVYDAEDDVKRLEKWGVMEAYFRQLRETNIHLKQLDEFLETEDHGISKFHIVCRTVEEKTELMKRLKTVPGIAPISTASHNIEIVRGTWSKKDGLDWLCRYLGISADEVLAIGDSENDREQLCWAHTGVAMKNASENIRNAADYVTDSNEEDGVARALEYYLNL